MEPFVVVVLLVAALALGDEKVRHDDRPVHSGVTPGAEIPPTERTPLFRLCEPTERHIIQRDLSVPFDQSGDDDEH